MGSISLKDVTKVFGDDIVAVDGVNLTIEDGEFIVLVGPSGSGKSTILRLIAGLDSVTEGEIQLESDDITKENPRDRDLAMVFQNYALYPHLTTRQNIAFGLKMRGEHSSNEIEEAVDGAAEMMDIMELLEDYPNELSGGQQQRVALGRAVVREPKAFLMDEPLSNLDAKLRTQMRTEINQLQNDLGITTIYVTHDQTEAMTMGDRIVILNDGNIQQVATPLDAYYAPSNKFVAGFIGSPSMNFFDINFSWQDDVLCLQGNEFSIEVSPDFAEETPEVDTAVLGIRPEDIQVNPTNKSNTISAFVEVVEPLGKEQIIYFELNNTMYTASVDGYKSIDEDEKIEVLFPESRIHLFDSTSGGVIKQRSITEDSSVALHRV